MTGMLDGKVALITGTGRGQGRAAALTFAREGAKVVGCDILAAESEETRELVRAAGGEMETFGPVDLSDPEAARQWIEEGAAAFGGVDILYNNASAAKLGPIAEASIEDWQYTIRNELDLVFYATKFAWRHLVERGGGVVINIASIAATMGVRADPMVAHCAAKGGVLAMTNQVACEGAPLGIRAVSISPGPIDTPATAPLVTSNSPVVERTLLGRWGTPEEVVELAAFLASDRASYITGANVEVSGGQSAW